MSPARTNRSSIPGGRAPTGLVFDETVDGPAVEAMAPRSPDERKRVFGPPAGQRPRPPLAHYSRDANSPIFRAVTTARRMPSPLKTIVAPGATSRTSEASRPTTTLASPNTGDRTIVSRKDLATWMLVSPG